MELLREEAVVHDGGLVFPQPLDLPEGASVLVTIHTMEKAELPPRRPPTEEEIEDFMAEPFFGMWADREDMADGAAWERERREQWRQRLTRQD